MADDENIMSKLHEKPKDTKLEASNWQRGLSCSSDGYFFQQETVDGLSELGDVIRSIRKRLMSEGYEIKDGKIYKHGVQQQI